jgi:putative Mg2+ transporter-C (MgtC) family protein
MDNDYTIIAARLAAALLAGSLIGLERSFHGRPAGFRTHALVCLASSLLMLTALYQSRWGQGMGIPLVRTDPIRMAQGIMTGIGFLGGGVIFREGLTIRGLTTAASIWLTAAIGILIGVGFNFAALVGTTLTLGTLSVFRWIEARMPSESFAHHYIRFARANTLPEAEVRRLLEDHGFTIANMSYRTSDDGSSFEYRMVIRTTDSSQLARLAESLRKLESAREFRISPIGH